MLLLLDAEIVYIVCTNLSTREVLNLVETSKHLGFCRRMLCSNNKHGRNMEVGELKCILYVPRSISTKVTMLCKINDVNDLIRFNVVQGKIIIQGMDFEDEKDLSVLSACIEDRRKKGSRLVLQFSVPKTLRLGYVKHSGLKYTRSIFYFIHDGKIDKSFLSPIESMIRLEKTIPHINKFPILGARRERVAMLIPFDHPKVRVMTSRDCGVMCAIHMSKLINFSEYTFNSFIRAANVCLKFLVVSNRTYTEVDKYDELMFEGHDEILANQVAEKNHEKKKNIQSKLPKLVRSYHAQYIYGKTDVEICILNSQRIYHCLVYEMMGIKHQMFMDDERKLYKKDVFNAKECNESVLSFCIAMDATINFDILTWQDFERCKGIYNSVIDYVNSF